MLVGEGGYDPNHMELVFQFDLGNLTIIKISQLKQFYQAPDIEDKFR